MDTAIQAPASGESTARTQEWFRKKGLTIAVVALTVMTTLAYVYLGYHKLDHSRQLANYQEQSLTMQRSLSALRQSERDLATATKAPAAEVPTLESLRKSLLSPNDGIRVVDKLTQLAERSNVLLNTIELSPGKREKVGDVSYDPLQVNVTAQGDRAALAAFFDGVQGGILPWLLVDESQTNLKETSGTLTLRASIYTLAPNAGKTATAPDQKAQPVKK